MRSILQPERAVLILRRTSSHDATNGASETTHFNFLLDWTGASRLVDRVLDGMSSLATLLLV